MPARSGSRVRDPLGAASIFGKDFGEDWVVPKAAARYLVVRAVDASLLITAYGPDGQILGERLFADAASGASVMERLAADGFVDPWRDIPDGASSATRFLNEGTTA